MTLSLTAPPAVEPVSLGDAKAFLRVSHTEEDQLISNLLRASRERIEFLTGLSLIRQSWRETLDVWPVRRMSACGQAIRLPRRPLISVEGVRTFDRDGAVHLWDPAEYRVEPGEPGRIVAIYPFGLPVPERTAGGIEIDFTAGFGDAGTDIPAALNDAILQLVAVGYAGAEPAQTARRGEEALPLNVQPLVSPWLRYAL